jgi:2-polyprenyl-6-methoxyphenol hydroxylase-like FAD-dependent oxidoreductase
VAQARTGVARGRPRVGSLNALIVGGGPGGMTAAIALARLGVRCEIVERSRDWQPAGIGIGLQSAPLRALKSLDLLEPLVEVGRPHESIDMLLADGTQIGVMPQVNVNEPDDPPFITMSRRALHEVLARRLRELEVEVRLGMTVSSFAEEEGGVRARFSDGSEGAYDLVIGADGMHSQTRGMVLPDAPEPEFAGQVIWRIGVRRPDGLERYTMMIAGPTRIGLVPIGDEQLYMWMLDSTLPAERPPRDELLWLFQQRMAAYAGYGAEVAAEITEPEQVDFRALHWVLVPPPWGAGRVLLLGDAAHTTTPHLAFGVGLAIEDAVVLADLVADGCDPRELAPRLTERRFERCRLVVDTCLQLSRWEQVPGPPNPRAGELIGSTMAALAEPI